jgi:hypothetical protein
MATLRATLNVPIDTHARLLRLGRLHNKPTTWLIERWSAHSESRWKARMSDAEWRRYLADDISFAEAGRIRQREQEDEADADISEQQGAGANGFMGLR